MSEAIRKILILSANPRESSKLRVEREKREIKDGLRRAQRRDLYSIETAEAVRYNDIHRAILDCKPNIVHFSGHGTGEAGLVFEDEVGQAKLVDAEGIAGLFKLFASQVECVVLNACYSEVQARAISKHISYVVGMSQKIKDGAAIQFAIGFYDALGADQPYEFAYQLGCQVIRLAGIPQHLIPQLLVNKDLPPTEHQQYNQLGHLLAEQLWQDADRETAKIMSELAGQGKNWLTHEDISNFPCSHLHLIDRLWLEYSQRRFGFTVQKKIWQKLGGNLDKFGCEVGWKNGPGGIAGWRDYSSLLFTENAVMGHLPNAWTRSPSWNPAAWMDRKADAELVSSLVKRLAVCRTT